ncbi:MAG: anthrone oxygenase family protein [Pseudomonadota bacterium]|uniref:anthrone oxygenase family protein n=1 Tax=Sphingomonas sp. ERG5 TaxID=1381597 RepID=UPI00054B5C63|nr:anthrone oxygenase family protein [Sphingomonas sp. ERG5]
MKTIPSTLLIGAAIATALNAGVFYAFSSFVMAGLGRIPPEQGANAMNAISVTAVMAPFMILFMGATLLCLGLAGWSLFSFSAFDSKLILAASLFYVIGCFGVTAMVNVPLNDQLAAAPPTEIVAMWRTYLHDWVQWNHVRTIASTLSALLYIIVLVRR